MHASTSYRQGALARAQALSCPYCDAELFAEHPRQPVSMARCPHASCHRVMLVCTREASSAPNDTDTGAQTMTLDEFVRAPPRQWEREDLVWLPLWGLFVGAPVALLTYALLHLHWAGSVLIVFTQLAPLLFAALLVRGLYDDLSTRYQRRRRALRAHATRAAQFPRACLLPTSRVDVA